MAVPCPDCNVLNSVDATDTSFSCIQCHAQHDTLMSECVLDAADTDELVPTDVPNQTVTSPRPYALNVHALHA